MFIKPQSKRGATKRGSHCPAGFVLCIIFIFSPFCGVFAEMRVWHGKAGTEYIGEFEREFFGKLFLRGLDKKMFSIAATNLIAADLDFARTKVLPKIKISFFRNVREREKPEYGWANNNEVDVKGVVKIRKISKNSYAGTLKGECYLIAKEIATDDYRLFAKKSFPIEFPDEKNAVVEYKITAMVRNYIQFNEPRGAFYEGHVVIVSDGDGNPLEISTDLYWVEKEQIAALRRLPVPGFLDRTCRKRRVPRPTDYRMEGEVTQSTY
jgi:hypothetical protein